MQEYPIKRGYGKNLEENMIQSLRDQFGVEPLESGGHHTIAFGALQRLEVWTGEKGKTLIVDTESNADVDDETIIETNRRFRKYLELVTGYNSKERAKKAKKVIDGLIAVRISLLLRWCRHRTDNLSPFRQGCTGHDTALKRMPGRPILGMEVRLRYRHCSLPGDAPAGKKE